MGCSSLLFITLIMSLSLLWSFVQTSQSLDNSESIRMTRSTGRRNNATDILHSESSDSVEGSGHSVHSMISQNIINRTLTKEPERASNENRSGFRVTMQDTGHNRSRVHIISEEALLEGSHITTEEHTTIVNDNVVTGGDSPDLPVQTKVLTSITNQNLSGSEGPCVLGPCVVLTNFNGTNLLWDDMKRTLAFAWELHVFGSASLFILMAVLAVLGTAGASTLPKPLCDVLILPNSLLILSATLRAVLLLLDPYGTRQILSHATLAALHNVSLQSLLWAQVALVLVTLREFKLLLFLLKLQCPLVVVAGLAISHCTLLLVADLYSSTLSPALPLLLQMLSLCWGLPFCMGVLTKSFSQLHPSLSSSVPQCVPSNRIEKHAKQVTAVSAFFGVLCCSLHMYSLLWLYGLLGNWRRFGWGWWLSQFWARILELSWGFSLVVLGSWIFWTPSRGHSRGDHVQGRGDVCKGVEETSLCGRVLAIVQRGPLRKSGEKWEDLMPNNWAKYNMSRAGINNNTMCPCDNQSSTIISEYKPDTVSSSDSHTSLLWQNVGERECVLSFIEFDMPPQSPINLRRSIDNALHHGQLVAGGLFTPPPPPWTHMAGQDGTNGETFPPAYVGYGWMLDTESINASLDYFQAKEPMQSPSATIDHNDNAESPPSRHQGEEFNPRLSAVMHQHDWSDDDITDL
ncbi:hypothetical protein PAMA_010591 [Pampus argenteus]